MTGIVDSNMNVVVEYSYDAWGKLIETTGSEANFIGKLNPFLYRGYYYDAEIGLYYLNSRYYDPVIGRFLNEDSYVSTGQDLMGSNMFVYCGNNPVNNTDLNGEFYFFGIEILFGSDAITAPRIGFSPFSGGISIPIAPSIPTIPIMGPMPVPSLYDIPTVSNSTESSAPKYVAKSKKSNLEYTFRPIAKAGGGKKPELEYHNNGKPPHFHPAVDNVFRVTRNMATSHDHYYFPKSKFSFDIYNYQDTTDLPVIQWID